MKKCPNCFAEVPDGVMFCDRCGIRITEEKAAEPGTQQNRQPEEQAQEAMVQAVAALADACLPREKEHARALCEAAFDAAKRCDPKDPAIQLAEKYLRWGQPQAAQTQLDIVGSTLDADFVAKLDPAGYDGDMEWETYKQTMQLAFMRTAMEMARVQANVDRKLDHAKEAESLQHGAFQIAQQLAQAGMITWESIQAGHDLAALLDTQGEKSSVKRKECLSVSKETLTGSGREKTCTKQGMSGRWRPNCWASRPGVCAA